MKRKLAVLLTAATVFSAILPTTCMAAEKKADIPEGTTISFWHAMGGVNGEALDYLVNKFNEENEYGINELQENYGCGQESQVTRVICLGRDVQKNIIKELGEKILP